jgi:hypothetical protein
MSRPYQYPVADQIELRYRMRVDFQVIELEAMLAPTAAIREATRRYKRGWSRPSISSTTHCRSPSSRRS